MNRLQRQFALATTLAAATLAGAQTSPPRLNNMTPTVMLGPAAMIQPAAPPCARPVEPFDVDDYDGPLNQLVARFSQRIESTTVHLPRHHGIKPCALNASDKFHMFVESTADPINYVSAAWDAATAQWDRDDPAFSQGAEGYGKRYGAAVVDNATSDFFGIFLYPAIFRQDPRYYRLGQGPAQARLTHALAHRFVTRGDSGKLMPNYSEWFGTVSSKALSNLYHPGNPRGFGPTSGRVGLSVANDVAWDVVREYWPEIAHKFKLPFRTHKEPYAVNAPVKRPPARIETIAEDSMPVIEPAE
jgi:hypothetical protein